MVLLVLCLACSTSVLLAQELEPRTYANTPVGMNYALAGYAYSDGDVLLEPSSPLQDASISTHATVVAYARSFNLLGDSAKFDMVLPYAWCSGEATYQGQPQQREVDGFGDPTLRFTWNFIGASAMTLQEAATNPPNWIVGASFRLGLPLGQYDHDRLLNIGANRWSFKPELGISKAWRRWTFELAAGASIFTDNEDFMGSQTREQEPLGALQAHVLYSFGRGFWAGLDGTVYAGGRTTVDDTLNDDRQSNSRIGLTLALPISRHHTLKLAASTGATARIGGKFTTVGMFWQYRWGGQDTPPAPAP